MITFRQLKERLATASDAQLDWPVVIFEGDNEIGNKLEAIEESQEDFYWLDGECYGMMDGVEDAIKDDPTLTVEDFTLIPKGTITLHYALSEIENQTK